MSSLVKEYFKKMNRTIRQDVWDIDLQTLPKWKAFFFRILRIAMLVIRGIKDDALPVHASALTFSTLMSLVPFLAIVFALLRGLGFGQEVIDSFFEWQTEMPEEFQGFMNQIVEVVNSAKIARMGGIGLLFVVLFATMVLNGMEVSFNRIWGISQSRNMLRRVSNYISLLVVVPIFIMVASTISATLQNSAIVEQLGSAKLLYLYFLRLAPLLSVWFALTFLYLMLPNTKVNRNAAIISGLIAGIFWLLWQKLYITMQLGVGRYNAIYGTFASIPIFLAWLYTGWLIILLGAETAFSIQYHNTLYIERNEERASIRSQLMLAYAVIIWAARAFLERGKPLELAPFAEQYRVPIRLVRKIVSQLESAGLLAAVADCDGCFVMLRSPGKVTLGDITQVILSSGASIDELGFELSAALQQLGAEVLACNHEDLVDSKTVEQILSERELA